MLEVVGQQCWVRFHAARVRNIAEPIVYLFIYLFIYLVSILWVRQSIKHVLLYASLFSQVCLIIQTELSAGSTP